MVFLWKSLLLLLVLLFGILMLPVFIVTKNVFELLLCLMPLAMGAMCVIPMKMKTGLLYNDGTRYKRLRSGGQEGSEENAIFQLIEVTLFGGEEVNLQLENMERIRGNVSKAIVDDCKIER